jgi:hypothetical protein
MLHCWWCWGFSMRNFATGATRDDDTNKFDYEGFLSPFALERFATYMQEHRIQADGKPRASDNWQRGIPTEAYMKSMLRHVMELWRLWRGGNRSGKAFEDTLCAIQFNQQGLLHEATRPRQQLNDPALERCKELGIDPKESAERGAARAGWTRRDIIEHQMTAQKVDPRASDYHKAFDERSSYASTPPYVEYPSWMHPEEAFSLFRRGIDPMTARGVSDDK